MYFSGENHLSLEMTKGGKGNTGIFVWLFGERAIREPQIHSSRFIHIPHLKAPVLLPPDLLEPVNITEWLQAAAELH